MLQRLHSLVTSVVHFVPFVLGMVVVGSFVMSIDVGAQEVGRTYPPVYSPSDPPRAASFAPPLQTNPIDVAERAYYSSTIRPREPLSNPQPTGTSHLSVVDASHAPLIGASPPFQTKPSVSVPFPGQPVDDTSPLEAVPIPQQDIATSRVGLTKTEPSGNAMATDELMEQMEKAHAAIEKNETLTPEKKEEYLELLGQSSNWLKTSKESDSTAARYRAEIDTAPQAIMQVKQLLSLPLDPKPEYPLSATLMQLEQSLNQAEEALETAREELTEHEENANSENQANRKAKIAEQKETLKQQLQEAEESLKSAAEMDGDSMVPVHQIALETRRRSLESQLAMLDAERTRLDSLAALFPLKRDLAQRRLTQHQVVVETFQAWVTNFRKNETQRQAEEARRLVDQVPPSLRKEAERNAELAENRIDLANNMEIVTTNLASVRKTLGDIDEDFKDIQNQIDVAGMTPTVGLLMRNRQGRLPDVQMHTRRIKESSKKMRQVQVALLELETERSKMADLDETVKQTLGNVTNDEGEFDSNLENVLRNLLEVRSEYLNCLIADYDIYHGDLNVLALDTRKLVEKVDDFQNFINEHVLWIRSARPLSMADVNESTAAIGTFMNVRIWKDVVSSTGHNATQNPTTSTLIVVACIVMFVFRQRLLNRLDKLGERVSGEENTTLVFTLRSLLVSIILASVWPLVFWGIGWWMSMNAQAPELALSLARGLKAIATAFFVAELFRQVCRPHGLAEQHFGWNIAWVKVLHRSVGWLMVLTLPILFLVAVIGVHNKGAWNDSLGRLVFLFGLVIVTAYLHDLLHPWKGAFQVALARTNAKWPSRFRYLWYALGIGFPLMLAALIGLGYTYSATQLMIRFQGMICLVLALVLVHAILVRAIKVTWNRMSRLRASLEAQRQHMLNPTEDEEAKEKEEAEEAVQNVDKQLSQLVHGLIVLAFAVGTWFIWADMFPAFQILDKVEFWSVTRTVVTEGIDAKGEPVVKSTPKTIPITLTSVIFAILVMIATMVVTKTLPGVLEISILGRLPIDKGARNAIVILCRYLVTLTGVLWACQILGMTWASVQWLAAAMTVGLAFGLQEIFANMVSGLIILFERPIRMGDMVTVSGVTGKVSKMQIRATTITDLDRRELIVPNKRFITDDVVNWSLSDPISRFIVPVGISYDSDPSEAHRVLLEVADQVPLILKEPAPSAVFVAFGDSTLNLELRSFISSRDHYAPALHATNLAIEKAFREANIEIAFPQQDLHIRGVSGLFEVMNRDQTEQSPRKAA